MDFVEDPLMLGAPRLVESASVIPAMVMFFFEAEVLILGLGAHPGVRSDVDRRDSPLGALPPSTTRQPTGDPSGTPQPRAHRRLPTAFTELARTIEQTSTAPGSWRRPVRVQHSRALSTRSRRAARVRGVRRVRRVRRVFSTDSQRVALWATTPAPAESGVETREYSL